MKLDYSKLEETIAEAIKIEKERENENKRKHSKKGNSYIKLSI